MQFLKKHNILVINLPIRVRSSIINASLLSFLRGDQDVPKEVFLRAGLAVDLVLLGVTRPVNSF